MDWWVILLLSFTGGYIGGVVAYHLEAGRQARARFFKHDE